MKCEKCQDRGFTEENHGLTMILCDCDKAREVAEAQGIPWRGDKNISEAIGLLFQLLGKRTDEHSDDELWMMTKESAIEKMEFPHIVDMPCGKTQYFANQHSILTLPIEDIPCYCGNPNHYIVRFIDARDDSNSGTRADNQPAGSADTGKPKQPKKQRAKKKARKRTS